MKFVSSCTLNLDPLQMVLIIAHRVPPVIHYVSLVSVVYTAVRLLKKDVISTAVMLWYASVFCKTVPIKTILH